MKRLAPACCLLALLACASGNDDAKRSPGNDTRDPATPLELRYFRWADPTELDATREALARFEELNPGIRVKLEYTNWGGYGSKLQTLIAGGQAPDVFALSGAYFHDLRTRGALEELAPYVASDPTLRLDGFFEPPLEIFRWEGRLYGIPRDFNVVALFYNRDHFDEAKLAYPDSSWTWADLRRAAIALTRDTDGDGKTDRWGLQVSNDMEVCWGNYVFQNGGRILDEERARFAMTSAETIEALEFLRALIYEDHVSPSPLDMESLSGTPFRNGRLSMITSGSWTLAALDAAPGFNYGVAPLPMGRRRAVVANGVAHAIATSSPHKDAAWKLVSFLSGPEGQRLLARSGTSIPALRSVASSPNFLGAGKAGVDRAVFLTSMASAHTLPFTPGLARWGGAVLQALDRVWLGERSPEAAMKEIEGKVNAVLAENGASPP
jgi:multiple sugar transport system substrate-binding protein